MSRPELLAPAGSPEALRAAVQCGADAVYLGWGSFNARRGARNFSDEEFPEALAYCHARGVRVFLTLNTLLTDQELPQALETASAACRLGVDAVLVQDWGLLALLRSALPDLPLHASTQMSLFTSGGAREAWLDGCRRVVIARECSAEDTAAIVQGCPGEIEVFGHGALCMCYSGQCAMSAIVGGRSGNRGRCAQPCRLPYGLNAPAGGQRPLSLKDNCLANALGEMADLGVACVKLEGRMKRPEYVAVVTSIYARLLKERRAPTPEELRQLEEAFSRSGFTDWYWRGRRGADMFGARPENTPEPTELFAAARTLYERDHARTVPVDLHCHISPGAPATLTATDGDGHTVTVTGPVPEAARTRPLTAEDLESRLRKTGGTAYFCRHLTADVAPGLSLSAAGINALRREALSALTEVRIRPPLRRALAPPPLPEDSCRATAMPQWTVSVARADQLTEGLLALRPARVLVPLEVLADLTRLPAGDTTWCATLPRVWRDRDEALLRDWLEHARALGVTGAMAGNLGHLPLLRDSGLYIYGDFGLNVFNSRSLAYLREKGLESACVSFELRFSQLRDLRMCLPTEAIVYGRLPLMITENCLMASGGVCRSGPKGECRRHGADVLRDRTGAAFPLLSAFGHRTELQNSRTLWLADLADWRGLGLSYARLRFTVERPEECVQVFRDYLSGAPAPGPFTRGLYRRGVE